MGPSLLRSRKKMTDLLSYIPEDRLLLETDFPYTWVPDSWKRYSYGEMLFYWYNKVASTRSIGVERLIDIVMKNGSVFMNVAAFRKRELAKSP